MAFYTFCDKVGSKIYHRYVNDHGSKCQEVVTDFPIDLYLKGNGEYKDIFGTSLKRFDFDNMSDAGNFVRQYEELTGVHGQTDFVSQFISTTYPGFIDLDMNKFKVLNFDIEVRHDGYDDDDIVKVRRNFSDEPIEVTIAEMKQLSDVWEVYDKYNEKWYPWQQSPLLLEGGFPEAKDAFYEVMTISCKMFGDETRTTFGLKDYQTKRSNQVYIKCDNEKDLLLKFIEYVRSEDPDALTGWNIESFDIPYLINRMRKIEIPEEIINRLSPFHAHTSKCIKEFMINREDNEMGFKIFGIQTFDLYLLYKMFILEKQESYKLDNIGEIEVHEKKVDYSEYDNSLMKLYLDDYDKFVEYNEKDVDLVEKIDQKRKLIRIAVSIVLMTHSKYDHFSGKVKPWDNLIYNMLREDGIVIPPMHNEPDETIAGAFVLVPEPGKFRNVVSFDFTSLYPTIMMMYNMSPETLVKKYQWTLDGVEKLLKGEDLSKEYRNQGYIMAANGAVFRSDIEGVVPRAAKYAFDTRKKYKKLMLEEKKKKEKYLSGGGKEGTEEYELYDSNIAQYDAMQSVMKVLANSLYGACANIGFRYFSRSIAEGITLTGQFTIQETFAVVNKFLNKLSGTPKQRLVCTDTDSCYFDISDFIENPNDPKKFVSEMDDFCEKKLSPFISMVQENIGKRFGCPKNIMDMKREALIGSGIWRGKKNYVCMVYDMEGVRYAEPMMKAVGIQTKRSDQPMVIRKELEKCLEIMLEGTEEQFQQEVERFEREYKKMSFSEIAKPIGISDIKSTAWHAVAGQAHNALIEKLGLHRQVEKIKSGSKVKIVKLKKANPIQSKTFAFQNELSPEFGIDKYVDRDLMYQETFIKTLESFTKIIGWQPEKKADLMDLFG